MSDTDNLIYTIGYVDYINNEISSSENVYNLFSSAIYDINYRILEIIEVKFDLNIQNKYLFSEEKLCEKFLKNKLNIDNKKSLLFIRTDKTIDIYLCETNKGYVYNSEDIRHYYKFYINKHHCDFFNEDNDCNKENLNENNSLLFLKSPLQLLPDLLPQTLQPKENKRNHNIDLINELKEKLKELKIKNN